MVSDYNPYENESYQQDIYSSQNTQPEAAESTAQASQIPPTAQISSPEQSAPSQASPSQATPAQAAPQYNPYMGYSAMPVNPAPQPKEKKKKSGIGKIVAVAICCSLLGGIVGAGGALFGASLIKEDDGEILPPVESSEMFESTRKHTALNVSSVEPGEAMSAAEVYAQNVNSTVGITTQVTTNYFGYQTTSPASGSGFILTEDGYIVTNHHVIDDAQSVKVTTYDGTEYDAVIVGSDESNDIAVLKIDAKDLSPVVLGNSDSLNVGDEVIAIGNPLGELTFSLTKGWVSALDREITLSGGVTMNLIQTDCAINAGNSGGPLFNIYGEVIGVTNAKYSSNSLTEASIDNIGFAIPIDSVKRIINEIVENGYVSKPYIGVTIETVSEDMVNLGIPAGAIIRSVTEGSPADTAGLKENDIVVSVNGNDISSSDELKDAVSASSSGDVLKTKVYRRGETIEIDITVGEQETNDSAPQPETPQQSGGDDSRGGWDWDFDFGDLPFGNWF